MKIDKKSIFIVLLVSCTFLALSGCNDNTVTTPYVLRLSASTSNVLRANLNNTATTQFTVVLSPLNLATSGTKVPLAIPSLIAPFSLVKTGTTQDCLMQPTLTVGTSCTLTVAYHPTTSADYFKQTNLQIQAGSAQASINVLGYGANQSFLLSSQSNLWERGFSNSTLTGQFTYQNISPYPIQVQFNNSALPSEVHLTHNACSQTLAPGGACAIQYTFTGDAAVGQGASNTIAKTISLPMMLNLIGFGTLAEPIPNFSVTTYGNGVFVNAPLSLGNYHYFSSNNAQALVNYQGILYAGTINSGFYISLDQGQTWRNYSVSDGLPSNTVLSFAVAHNQLFIGTNKGLVVANNVVAPTVFNTYLAGIPISCLTVADNHLYIGTQGDGLMIANNSNDLNTIVSYSTSSHPALPDNTILSLAVMNNQVAVGTDGGGLALGDNATSPTHFVVYRKLSSPLPSNTITALWTADNVLYVGTNNGLALTNNPSDRHSFKVYSTTTTPALPNNFIAAITTANNVLYVATSGGLAISNDLATPTAFTTYSTASKPALPSNNLLNMVVLNNQLYIGTLGSGLAIVMDANAPQQVVVLNATNSSTIPNQIINSLQVVNNQLYVATPSGLAIANTAPLPDSFQTYTTTSKVALPGDDILSFAINNNILYVGTDNGLAVSTNANAPSSFTTYQQPVLPNNGIVSLLINNGNLYVGTEDGLAISPETASPPDFTVYSTTSSPALPGDYIASLATTNNTLYVGTNEGLAIGNTAVSPTAFNIYLSNQHVSQVLVSESGLYVATHDHGLAISSNSQHPDFKIYSQASTPALPNNDIVTLAINQNRLYIANFALGLTIGDNAINPSKFTTYSTSTTPALPSNNLTGYVETGEFVYLATSDMGLEIAHI